MDLEISTRAFDHAPGKPEFPGDRGVVVEATTGYSGRALAAHMPDAFLTMNGEIEFDGYRVPVAVFRAWTAAVLDTADRLTLAVEA